MDQAGFWSVIDRVHAASSGDMDRKCELLAVALAKLPKAEALSFAEHFDAAMIRAYCHDLWGAAYVINGGCSDDTFSDFQSALISRGQRAFEQALADPDALAGEDFDEETWFYEGFEYAVTDGVTAAAGERPMKQLPNEPAGTSWEEEDLGRLYPRLSAKFG